MTTEFILKLALAGIVLIWIAVVYGALWLVTLGEHLLRIEPVQIEVPWGRLRTFLMHCFLIGLSCAIVFGFIFLLFRIISFAAPPQF